MLSINTNGLSSAKIYIQRAVRNLDSASRKLVSINVPSDFAYGGKLKSLASRISGIRVKANSTGNWIDQAVSGFNRAESANASLVNSLLSGLTIKRLKSNSIFNKVSKTNLTLADKFRNAQIKINGAGLSIISSIGAYIGKNIKSFSEGDIKGVKDSIGNLIGTGAYIGSKIQSVASKVPNVTTLSNNVIDGDSNIKIIGGISTIMNIPNFYQNNQKVNFKNPEHEDKTNKHVNGFADTGCGVTSTAMILSYLTGKEVSIQDVMDWCDDPQYGDTYFNGNGSTGEIFQGAAEHWNVGNVEKTTDKEKVKNALANGQPVVSLQKKGQFTNGQHFIVLTGINQVVEDGKTEYTVNINNPRSDKPETPDKIFDLEKDVDKTNIQYYIFDAKPEKVTLG